jgi:hypothetical protein
VEKNKVGGKAGLLIDVINTRDEARYYLTLEEATQLSTWLTERMSSAGKPSGAVGGDPAKLSK